MDVGVFNMVLTNWMSGDLLQDIIRNTYRLEKYKQMINITNKKTELEKRTER